jgi:hypothetical protein
LYESAALSDRGRCGQRCTNTAESTNTAVSRKPMAVKDALVYGLYGLTKEEVRVVAEGEKR